MGSNCCRNVKVTDYKTLPVSHHYVDLDKQFTSWIYQQQRYYEVDKSACDEAITRYMQLGVVLKQSEWEDWFREQMRMYEETRVREIHKRYEEKIVRIESIQEMRRLHKDYEEELQRLDLQFKAFHKQHQETQQRSLRVTEQNLIAPVVLSPPIERQLEDVQREEECFLNWLHYKRSEESLSESLYWKYLQQHIKGHRVQGWPPRSENTTKIKAERTRFKLDSAKEDVLRDLHDNLEQDIQQTDESLSKTWLKSLLKRYRRDQHVKLIGGDAEEAKGGDDNDLRLIDELMAELEEQDSDSEMSCDKVYDYLKEICRDTGEDVEIDRDDIKEVWRFSEGSYSQEDMLARIQLLKLMLAKKLQEAKKARLKDEKEQKQREVIEGDRTYIGQLTSDDLEDREKLAEGVGEQLKVIADGEIQEEELDDVRVQAEEEIRGHSGDITTELLMALMEKYRQMQLKKITNREGDATEETGGDKVDDDITDAEFVDKINFGEVDPEMLAKLLRDRFRKDDKPGHTDDDKEISEEMVRQMEADIEYLEGPVEKTEVLSILLKYRNKHRQAAEDRKIKTSFEEDEGFVEGIDEELLKDGERVLDRVLAHVREPEHLLLGEVADRFTVEDHGEQEEGSNTEENDTMDDEVQPVPGMTELEQDEEYREKLNALSKALERLLDERKETMSKEELLDVLMEHRKQIALLIESRKERDQTTEEREKDIQTLRHRESVSSDDYQLLMEEFEADKLKWKSIRENEKNHIQKRFEVILAARLASKGSEEYSGTEEGEDEEGDIAALDEAIEQKKRGEMTEEAFLALMRQHMMEKISIQEHRGKEKSRLQEKLQLALKAHHHTAGDTASTEVDTDLDSIDNKYRKKLRDVTDADAQEVVRQYRNERERLIQDKIAQKKRLDDKLKDRMDKTKENQRTPKPNYTEDERKDRLRMMLDELSTQRKQKVQVDSDQKKRHADLVKEKLEKKRREGKLKMKQSTSGPEVPGDAEDKSLASLLGSVNTIQSLIRITQQPEQLAQLKHIIKNDFSDKANSV